MWTTEHKVTETCYFWKVQSFVYHHRGFFLSLTVAVLGVSLCDSTRVINQLSDTCGSFLDYTYNKTLEGFYQLSFLCYTPLSNK